MRGLYGKKVREIGCHNALLNISENKEVSND
jgi:hypothetical protein